MKKSIFLTLLFCGVAVADMSRSGEIVTDSKTKLMWQDNSDASSVTRNWQGAIDYCEALKFGGHDDWRLPNINELIKIVDRKQIRPAINPKFVNVNRYIPYWSSTSYSKYSPFGWIVDFNDGVVSHFNKDELKNIRCIRGGR